MKKYCDVDLIKMMRMITKLHTEHYGDDVKLDEKVIKEQMRALKAGETYRYIWLSRKCGTNIMPLRDVFLKTSRVNYCFQYYCGDAGPDGTIPYLIEIVERKEKTIYGNIYGLDMDKVYTEVSQKALPIGSTDLVYEKGTRTIPGGDKIIRWDEEYGNLVDFHDKPENKWELDAVIKAFLKKAYSSPKSEPKELYKELKKSCINK